MIRTAPRPRRLSDQDLERLGLTRAEEPDFHNIRSKQFSVKETVEIIKRSRRVVA